MYEQTSNFMLQYKHHFFLQESVIRGSLNFSKIDTNYDLIYSSSVRLNFPA